MIIYNMDETVRIILIIIVSVSIFGLLLFVFVKNYMKRKIEYYLEVAHFFKYTKVDFYSLNLLFNDEL